MSRLSRRLPSGLPFATLLGFSLAVLLLAMGIFSSAYTVKADQEGVVLRFGRFLKKVPPGLHFKVPYGVDKVDLIPVTRQLKQEFGFGTSGATNPYQFSKTRGESDKERNMVTGDLNAAQVEWVVQYHVINPKQYLFEVRNPDETLRDASESVMREVVGDRTVDEVITIGRSEVEAEALRKLQELVDRYQMGIGIDQIQLKDVDPPEQVQASFNEVNKAQQDLEKKVNVASGNYNRVIPRANGQAEQALSQAEGYALQRVNEAEGEAARFNALFKEYLKAPEVTKRRMYLEMMGDVLPKLGSKIIIDEQSKQVLPMLNLSNPAAAAAQNIRKAAAQGSPQLTR